MGTIIITVTFQATEAQAATLKAAIAALPGLPAGVVVNATYSSTV